MNRFAIDEAATHEILKMYHLEHAIQPFRDVTLEEGMDPLNKGIIVHDSQTQVDLERSTKETRILASSIDACSIDAGVATMVDFGANDMMPHFIYCYGYYYSYSEEGFEKLKKIILKKMREYGFRHQYLQC